MWLWFNVNPESPGPCGPVGPRVVDTDAWASPDSGLRDTDSSVLKPNLLGVCHVGAIKLLVYLQRLSDPPWTFYEFPAFVKIN